MDKDYNTIPAQLSAISWQLKRIADALERDLAERSQTRPKRANKKQSKETSRLRQLVSSMQPNRKILTEDDLRI